MSRIEQTFAALRRQSRRALIPFITAGDPTPEKTLEWMQVLVDNGADIIELGVPFSDPMADGAIIQRASMRALAAGMTLAGVLDCVAAFRRHNTHTPVVLMGYANPLEAMGHEVFIERARASGVDGLLTVDYPPHECRDFSAALIAAGIDPVFLLAPTSSAQRIEQVSAAGRGYLYYVSLAGVTGAAHLDPAAVAARIPALRTATGLPVAVGFGIRDAATARAIGAHADGVIIGSRIVEMLEQTPLPQRAAALGKLIAELRHALDDLAGEKT